MKEKEILEKLKIEKHDFRLVFGRSKIDYDPDKEEKNRKIHEYSLLSAVDLLQNHIFPFGNKSLPFITSDPFHEKGEIRHQHMGVDDSGYIVFMVTTMREDETVRVISFRRAHEKEREIFTRVTGYIEQNV
jgi:uncharacterized DUF497 family protein